MTRVYGNIKIERLNGSPYVKLLEPFQFYSDILECDCEIPRDFVYDEESVPVFKPTNPEAGAIHDYLCRKDSIPRCTKEVAAEVYREFQAYYDSLETGWLNRIWDWIRRKFKCDVVKIAPGYFHRHRVSATFEELTGIS